MALAAAKARPPECLCSSVCTSPGLKQILTIPSAPCKRPNSETLYRLPHFGLPEICLLASEDLELPCASMKRRLVVKRDESPNDPAQMVLTEFMGDEAAVLMKNGVENREIIKIIVLELSKEEILKLRELSAELQETPA